MADYIDGMVLPTTARLNRGKYTEAEISALRTLAAKGAYDEEAVADAVFFPVVASANTIDSYGTYMLPSTLKNFAEDAVAGVAVLDSHDSRRLNFGMSVSGEYIEEGEVRAMRSDFFTLPGLQTEGLNTDTYIKGVQAGLFRDVSVGFYMPPESMIRCTICGKDMMRWWKEDGCSHFAGVEYEVDGGGTTRMEVAYGAVDGARLSEYSFVYDGATPGAGVAKARQMEDTGELDADTALRLERVFHTTFPRATRKYRGATLIGGNGMGTITAPRGENAVGENLEGLTPPKDNEALLDGISDAEDNEELEDTTVITPLDVDEPEPAEDDLVDDGDEEEPEGEDAISRSKLTFTKNMRSALNERYAEDGIKFGSRVGDAVTQIADEVKRLRGEVADLKSSNRSLETEASDGRAYRASLIEDLKREVIRSADDEENKEAKVARYMRLAEGADIETVKELRDDFAAAARSKFGAGRKTIEVEGKPNGEKARVPDSAYDDI